MRLFYKGVCKTAPRGYTRCYQVVPYALAKYNITPFKTFQSVVPVDRDGRSDFPSQVIVTHFPIARSFC